MKNGVLRGSFLAVFLALGATSALSDPIEGKWLRPSTGTLVEYVATGDQYCGTVLTGEFAGQSIGCLSGKEGTYSGSLIALDEGKTYKGKATVKGDVMSLKGCVLIVCKGEDWQRQ